jgi:hypothetical protein
MNINQGLIEGVNPIGSDNQRDCLTVQHGVFRAGFYGVLSGESGAGLLVSL